MTMSLVDEACLAFDIMMETNMFKPCKDTRFFHKLTKKEILHLLDCEVKDLPTLNSTFEAHNNLRVLSDHNPGSEPCWTCRGIADKLKMR